MFEEVKKASEALREALEIGAEYARQVLMEFDHQYQRHSSVEDRRQAIVEGLGKIMEQLARLEAQEKLKLMTPEPGGWSSLREAMKTRLFHECRGIMGTENFGQDDALYRALTHFMQAWLVKEAAAAPARGREAELRRQRDELIKALGIAQATINCAALSTPAAVARVVEKYADEMAVAASKEGGE